MVNSTQSLEVHTEFATLYFRGTLRGPDIFVARGTCQRLPWTVRYLRLDLHGVEVADGDARNEITALIRDWRRNRLGHVTIAAGVDDLRSLLAAAQRPAWEPPADSVEAALMATYL